MVFNVQCGVLKFFLTHTGKIIDKKEAKKHISVVWFSMRILNKGNAYFLVKKDLCFDVFKIVRTSKLIFIIYNEFKI